MDNGVESIYRTLKKERINGCSVRLKGDKLILGIEDKRIFLKNLNKTIKGRMETVAFFYKKDKDTGIKRNVKKKHILLQYGSAVKGKNVLKEKIYSDTENRLKEIFEEEIKGSKVCVLCDREYSKKVDNLKQAIYPIATKIKSLSGVREKREYYDNLCPLCYLVGSMEWLDEGLIYLNLPGKNEDSFVFLPKMRNLVSLNNFKTYFVDTSKIVDSRDSVSNLRPEKGFTEGEYTTLLYFYEKFFDRVWFMEKVDNYVVQEKEEICSDWVYMKVPSGIVKNVKVSSLKVSDSILRSIYELTKIDKLVYSGFVNKLFFSPKKKIRGKIINQINSKIRESVAEGILKDDFGRFTSTLLPRKGGNVVFTKEARDVMDNLIVSWRLDEMGLNETDLKDIKSVARIVGLVSLNHVSILYKLDKARNPTKFLDALRELSRRLIGLTNSERKKVYPPALTNLVDFVELNRGNRQRFEDIRNILIIYSCVELSMLSYGKKRK